MPCNNKCTDNNKRLQNKAENCPYRQFSTNDIKNFRKNLETVIIAPYNEKQVKGVGYNLTASNMIYSISQHRLLTIYDYKDGRYFKLKAHDTALVLSNEYFKLDSNIAGNFYSRVRRVSEGLGHISTTLDPNWKGMFLIAINNTTDKKIKVQISSIFEGSEERNGIATVVLRGINPGDNSQHKSLDSLNLDNPAMRIDILKELAREPSKVRHNAKYKEFRKLVEELDKFEPAETEMANDVNKIKEHAIGIRNSLMYENDVPKAKALISSLDWFSFDKNEELKNKINDLKSHLSEENYDVYNKKEIINEKISLLKKECDYILLCENVNQIHELINKHVCYYHKYDKIKSFILKLSENRITVLILTLLLFLAPVLLSYSANNSINKDTAIYSTLGFSCVSIITDLIISKVKASGK